MTILVKAVCQLAFSSIYRISFNRYHFSHFSSIVVILFLLQTGWLTLMEVLGVVEVLLKFAEAGCDEARKESADDCNGKCGKEG